MILLNTGNVGIGDTGPDALLDVKGTVCLDLNADEACTDNTAAISDARLKDNVQNITGALSKINQLRGVTFTWNGEYNTGTGNSLGFLAQEMETIFPELVITDTAGYKNLDYGKLTAVLTSGIQNMNQVIDLVSAPTTTPSIYISETGFVGIGTTTPGVAFDAKGAGNFGSLTVGGALKGGDVTATSTLNYLGTATSTWSSAGLSVAGGGLASSQGLTITGGDIISSGKLTLTDSATSTSSGGFTTTGWLNSGGLISSGRINLTGTATSTFDSSGLSVAGGGLKSSAGLTLTGGDAIISGTLNVDGTGDSYLMGNVGIGTAASPQAKLDVAGTVYLRGAEGQTGLYIDERGYAGIGTTTPEWLTQIAGTRPSLAISDLSAGDDNKHWLLSSMDGEFYIGPATDKYATSSPPVLFMMKNGFVGIGTTTPNYLLTVGGDIAATAFVNISTGSAKKDIEYLTSIEEENILDKIKDTQVATYNYNNDQVSTPNDQSIINGKRMGLIAENAPAEVLSIDGKGVDIYKLSTFTLAGLKALQIKVEDIAFRVASLETKFPSGNFVSPITQLPNYVITVSKDFLSSLASVIGDWANAALAETSKLFVASETATDTSYKTYSLQGSREEIQISGSSTLVMSADADGTRFAGIKIKFDESFIAATSETEPIKVIVTPTTRLNGSLYVSQKSRFGFEVREINSQDEGGMFDWIVIARKKGAEEPLSTPSEPVTPPAET
ncbi:MAG: tail fiber domain-containing protein, partial [Patescibacteria group bacterium]